MGIRVKVSEWGNSLAIRLPKAVVEQLNLEAGREAEFVIDGDTIRFEPARRTARQIHDDLIAEARRLLALGVTPPAMVDWGPDRGAERWYDDAPTPGGVDD